MSKFWDPQSRISFLFFGSFFVCFVFSFCCYCFLFFKTRLICVALIVLELALSTRMASNWPRSITSQLLGLEVYTISTRLICISYLWFILEKCLHSMNFLTLYWKCEGTPFYTCLLHPQCSLWNLEEIIGSNSTLQQKQLSSITIGTFHGIIFSVLEGLNT